jgi:hypothetical protein
MDRKQLEHQYKQNGPTLGVYCITNKASGKVLLGASANVDGILNRHRFNLRHGGHENKQLLNDWHEHGAENFTFEVIDVVQPKEDPGFDPRAAVEELYQLWREEYEQRGVEFYK